MSLGLILNHTYEHGCAVCKLVKGTLSKMMSFCIGITESSGRAKAAAELTRMGYYAAAKNLMMEDSK